MHIKSIAVRFKLPAAVFAILACPVVDCARAQSVLITAPTVINPGATTITPTSGGAPVPLGSAVVTVSNTTLTVNGEHSLAGLHLQAGAVLMHDNTAISPSPTHPVHDVHGMHLRVQGPVSIDATSRVDLWGRGYIGLDGPGAASNGAGGGGASHGGRGGNNTYSWSGPTYGSFEEPSMHGSGGGSNYAGSGGGVFRLTCSDHVVVDGAINAEGAPGGSPWWGAGAGGGSGGSIWIVSSGLSGSGLITASGGNGGNTVHGSGGSAGGGRIRIQCQGSITFSGSLRAYGGSTVSQGAAGTILLSDSSGRRMILDNGGSTGRNNFFSSHNFRYYETTEVVEPIDVDYLDVINGARLSSAPRIPLDVLCRSDLRMDATSAIDMSFRGHPIEQGPVRGFGLPCGLPGAGAGTGGGNGGAGGSTRCHPNLGVYGSAEYPTTFGCGGGGWMAGSGGGAVYVEVWGRFELNGSVVADGRAYLEDASNCCGAMGGGAGGSIWIKAGELVGNGQISARGGDARHPTNWPFSPSGGGGGGRVAIYSPQVNYPLCFWCASVATRISLTGGASGTHSGFPGTSRFVHWPGPDGEPFGKARPWSSGAPRLHVEPGLALGRASDLVVSGCHHSGAVFALIGFQSLPVPFELAPLGFPSDSRIYIDPISSSFLVAGVEGVARATLFSIPTSQVFLGARLLSQAIAFPTSGDLSDIGLTRAHAFVVR